MGDRTATGLFDLVAGAPVTSQACSLTRSFKTADASSPLSKGVPTPVATTSGLLV